MSTQKFYTTCPDLTIANTGSISNQDLGTIILQDAEDFTLFCVASGDAAKTYKIQVSPDGGVSYYDWQDAAGALIAAPLPGFAKTYKNPGINGVRVVASAAVASQTVWKVTKSFYS